MLLFTGQLGHSGMGVVVVLTGFLDLSLEIFLVLLRGFQS